MSARRPFPNIVLIGFMGSGKTVVGKALALRLGTEFVDTDDLIVENAGRSVAELFASEGETAFRRRERDAVMRALGQSGRVIAAGGGAPMPPDTWRLMRRGNRVVALTVSDEERRWRLHDDRARPLLAQGQAAIRKLAQQRRARYRAADLVLDTSYRTIDEVAEAIQTWLKGRP